jgi:hypothetical protein
MMSPAARSVAPAKFAAADLIRPYNESNIELLFACYARGLVRTPFLSYQTVAASAATSPWLGEAFPGLRVSTGEHFHG